jgi:ribosomal-protein-alanine N-acetyltransferase
MSLPKSLTLETPRLRLRIPALDDLPFVFSASRQPGFTDGMLWEPPQDESELIAPYQRGIKAWEEGTSYGFTIEDKISGTFLGRISIRKTDQVDLWDIGFWTHPEQQGQGYMSEAVGAIIHFGFERLNAREIQACHALWNKASARVLEKNGMRFVRYIEKGFKKRGEWVAENLLAVSRDDVVM